MDDERHLWPAVLHLIRERRPDIFLGEQVASADGLGWLDLVQTDLEAAGYAIGAVDTCSAGSGAPHIRQRLRFSAYDTRPAASQVQHPSRYRWIEWWAKSSEWSAIGGRGFMRLADQPHVGRDFGSGLCRDEQGELGRIIASDDSGAIGLDDSLGEGLEGLRRGYRAGVEGGQRERPAALCGFDDLERLAHDDDDQQRQRGNTRGASSEGVRFEPCGCDELDRMVDTDRGRAGEASGGYREDCARASREARADDGASLSLRTGAIGSLADADTGQFPEEGRRPQRRDGVAGIGRLDEGVFVGRLERPGPTNSFWRDADWLFCRDGKWRPVEPCTFPLVDGTAFRLGSGSAFEGKSRQGMLKGYGNAVDAEATRVFIEACADFFAHLDARRVTAELIGDLL
ncbi:MULTISPECIES: hypothetical protein [Agrobacterium]|uniref:hypothetical protein n=1 Tax=Agrobacterium TaxID=357 RepID=UPI001FD8E45D|nr:MULTISPECIES: hypothetical protein [Agrobacterium]